MTTIVPGEQTTGEIIEQVLAAHDAGFSDYSQFALQFNSPSPVLSARKVFAYCKRFIRYKQETGHIQSTRSLAAIIKMGYGDCKHYSQLIAGVMATLKQVNEWPIKLYFRFASYDIMTGVPGHVFIVMIYQGREYWIDPVLASFDQRSPAPVSFTDKKVHSMALVHISGAPAVGAGPLPFTVIREVTARRADVGAIAIKADDQPVTTVQTVQPGSPSTSAPAAAFNPLTADLGVQYLVSGVPLIFPMQNRDGAIPPLCPSDLNVIYPITWGGETVPPNLPRPFSVGNRILLLPHNVHQDVYKANGWKWLIFLIRVMKPIVNSYSLYPSNYWKPIKDDGQLVNTVLGNSIFWDTDQADMIDYVGNLPTVVPISADLIPEVTYLYATDKKDAKGEPVFEKLVFPDRLPGEPAFTIPKRIWVEYPATFKGVPVPANLPRPYVDQTSGLLQLWPKGITDATMKANYFFWLSFVTSVMVPFVKAYAPVDYTAKGNLLSDQILYDCDDRDIVQNYLAMPKTADTLLEKALNLYKDTMDGIIKTVGRAFVSISMLLPRQAFMLLCRVNFCGWGRKFHQGFKYDINFFNKAKEHWEKLGGNFTNLVDACENGREKIDLTPDNSETVLNDDGSTQGATVGEPITLGAALVIGASCVAAMAPILKLFTDDKTDRIIDGVAGAASLVVTATGNDPIGTGYQTNTPVYWTDPNTGQVYTINPPTQTGGRFMEFVRNNPVLVAAAAAAIGVGIYQATKGRKKLV